MLKSQTAWQPHECVAVPVGMSDSERHRHKEMEEQFVASVCRPTVFFFIKKPFLENNMSTPS